MHTRYSRAFRTAAGVIVATSVVAACSSSSGSSASPAASATSAGAAAPATSAAAVVATSAGSAPTSGAPASAGAPASGAPASGAPASAGAAGGVPAAAANSVPLAASGNAPDTTITICWFAGPEFDSLAKYAPAFTAMSKGKIKIKMVSIPINQALPVTINELRTSSDCDLVDGASEHATDINPYLLPLDSLLKDPSVLNASAYNLADFPKGVLTVSSSDKGLMSLPTAADVQMVFYRKDLFDKWGITIPTPPAAMTWQQLNADLVKAQAAIKSEGLKMSPVAITGTRDASSAMFSLGSMWSYGGNPFDGAKPNFTDPKAVAGLTNWTGLLNTSKLANPGSPTYAYNELLTSLQQGKSAMVFEWNAAVGVLNDPKQSPITAGKLGFALIPYDASVPATTARVFPTTHSLAISAKSKNPKEAFEYAAWYTSPPMAKLLAVERTSGARTSVLTDPSVLAQAPALSTVAASDALYHAMPNIPSFGDLLTNVIAPAVNGAFTGQKSAEQATKDEQSAAQALLAKAGK